MFAVQKTSIARSTVVCAAQKPVQAKVGDSHENCCETDNLLFCPSGLCPSGLLAHQTSVWSISVDLGRCKRAAGSIAVLIRPGRSSQPSQLDRVQSLRPAHRPSSRIRSSLPSTAGRPAAEGRPGHHGRLRRHRAALCRPGPGRCQVGGVRFQRHCQDLPEGLFQEVNSSASVVGNELVFSCAALRCKSAFES